jgi:hypothetical protein
MICHGDSTISVEPDLPRVNNLDKDLLQWFSDFPIGVVALEAI